MKIKIFFDEEWKPLIYKDIKPKYEISNKGRVRNVEKGKLMAISYSEKGYAMVSLMATNGKQKTFKLHRIMGFHFLELPDFNDGQTWTINHKNGDKTDNTGDNLEWVTFTDNVRHSYDTGLNVGLKGEANGSSIHSEELIRHICELMELGLTNRQIKTQLIEEGVDVSPLNRFTFYDIRHHKRWNHITRQYKF